MITTSFISANYVARANNYDGSSDWGYHDRATIESMTPQAFEQVARDVKDSGFERIDIWSGHCHYKRHAGRDFPEQVARICREQGLIISSYAGGFAPDSVEDVNAFFGFVARLGAPIFAGGIAGELGRDELPRIVQDAASRFGVMWGFENHPEKSGQEMLARIGNGNYPLCGLALDTGWAGTQNLDALELVKSVREQLVILHLKDVRAVGGHDTCALGDGVVNCEGVVRYLSKAGWRGNICIEHEPYDRDPMPEVQTSLARLRDWLA